MAVFATDLSQADRMLQAIAVEARKAGLEINADKTKVLVVGELASAEPTRTLSVNGVRIERVQHFVYLGSLRNACETWTITHADLERLRGARNTVRHFSDACV